MGLTLLIAIVGTALSFGRTFPQMVRILRQRHAVGVSLTSLTMGLVSSVAWGIYGLTADQPSVAITSSFAALQWSATLIAAKRHGGTAIGARPLLWAAGLALTFALAGSTGLGVLLAVSSLMTGLPQLQLARSGADLSGVSAAAWLCGLGEGVLWLTVGITSRDVAVSIWGLGSICVCAPVLLRLRASEDERVLAGPEAQR